MNTLFFSLSNAQLILPTFSRQPYPISIQPCINAFDRIAGKTGDRLQLELESCVRQCERIDPTARMSFGLEVAYQFCKTNVGNTGATPVGTGAGPKCDAAAGKLSTTQDSVFWQTCVSDCDAATEETSDTKLKQKYTNTSSACGAKVPPAELETPDPTEGLDGGTVADDDTTDDDATDGDPPADTGSPNNTALNSMLQGLGTANSSRTPIDGGRGLNFGGGGSGAGYSDVTGAGNGSGFQGSGNQYIPPIDDRYFGKPLPANANNGGGAGGGGMPGMGGGGGGGAPGANPARPAAGGPRASVAGSALGKFGTNQFWSGGSEGGGSGGAATPARKTATTAKDKKTLGPEYLNKGLGNDGLLRLWGAGLNKTNLGSQSQSCKDHTIFCTLENFEFGEMDRTPDSSGK